MPTFASTSFDAYTRLLAQPDPKDLPRRAHVCRCEGDPNRRDTRLPGIVSAWRQRRNLEVEEPVTGGAVESKRVIRDSRAAASGGRHEGEAGCKRFGRSLA
jgi:hypothetical protein